MLEAVLKQEQMIKLPIIFYAEIKQTFIRYLQDLSKLAGKLQEDEGRYIRPIMVIKAE